LKTPSTKELKTIWSYYVQELKTTKDQGNECVCDCYCVLERERAYVCDRVRE